MFVFRWFNPFIHCALLSCLNVLRAEVVCWTQKQTQSQKKRFKGTDRFALNESYIKCSGSGRWHSRWCSWGSRYWEVKGWGGGEGEREAGGSLEVLVCWRTWRGLVLELWGGTLRVMRRFKQWDKLAECLNQRWCLNGLQVCERQELQPIRDQDKLTFPPIVSYQGYTFMTWLILRGGWDGGGFSGKKAAKQFETCVSLRPLDYFNMRGHVQPCRSTMTSQHNTENWISRNVNYQHFVHAVCREITRWERKAARAEERVKSQDKQGNKIKSKEKKKRRKAKKVSGINKIKRPRKK